MVLLTLSPSNIASNLMAKAPKVLSMVLLVLTFSKAVEAQVTISWAPPTKYVNNTAIEETLSYEVSLTNKKTLITTKKTFSQPRGVFNGMVDGTYSAKTVAVSSRGLASTASSSIEFSIIDEGLDSDADGLNDRQEISLGTNPFSSDSDNDRVLDSVELLDGTNPLDRASHKTIQEDTICLPWNGFLTDSAGQGMANIFEHLNLGENNTSIQTKMFDSNGKIQEAFSFNLPKGGQRDLLVHDFRSRSLNLYGTVCSQSTQSNSAIRGTMLYYKQNIQKNGFEFALAFQGESSKYGSQYIPINTYNPSAAVGDSNNPIGSWAQITNESSQIQNGTINFWASNGEFIKSVNIILPPSSRYDVGLHEVGTNRSGIAEWIPQKNEALFTIQATRYYLDNSKGIQSFEGAVQHPGITPSGESTFVSFNTEKFGSFLELSNVVEKPQEIAITIYGLNGKIITESREMLNAKGTTHLDISRYAGKTRGTISIKPRYANSVISLLMEYLSKPNGGFYFAKSTTPVLPIGTVLSGSYNTYLNHKSELVISNLKNFTTKINIELRNSSGSIAATGQVFNLQPHETKIIKLNDVLPDDQYGKVIVTSNIPNSIASWITRERENEYELALTLNE